MMLRIPTNFTFREKQAILAMLYLTAGCDGRVGNREGLFFFRVCSAFNVPYEEQEKAHSVFRDHDWQLEMQEAFFNIIPAHKADANAIIRNMVEIDKTPEKLEMYRYLTSI